MAPRPPESLEELAARLREAERQGHAEVRFGGAHHTHVIVREGAVWRVRRLVLDRAKADAFREARGYFMPEHAEELSEPGPEILIEGTVDEVLAMLPAIGFQRGQ